MHIKGGRPLRSIGPTNLKQKEIFNALQRMTPDERVEQYIVVNETTPEDENDIRLMFNKIFHEYFNADALKAREIMVNRMRVPGTVHVEGFHASNADINSLDGGKTRRNRRRRRNRRSLKRKHSRRR
jgi:hypothetical protein